jgi:hypothetical protein
MGMFVYWGWLWQRCPFPIGWLINRGVSSETPEKQQTTGFYDDRWDWPAPGPNLFWPKGHCWQPLQSKFPKHIDSQVMSSPWKEPNSVLICTHRRQCQWLEHCQVGNLKVSNLKKTFAGTNMFNMCWLQ